MKHYKLTEENNRMIAEFMSGQKVIVHHNQYHVSWNELMPVVEKIDKLMLDQPIASPFEVNAEYVFSSLREVNIKLTFKRVVQFIEWYNEQIKS